MLASAGSGATRSTFRTLRALFLAGYVLNIILWFVPATFVGFFAGCGSSGGFLVSMFSIVRLLSQQGNLGATIFFVLIFVSNIVFIALALALPRRWVFLTASSVAAFFILQGGLIGLLRLFSASDEQMTYFLVFRVLQWVASLLTLLGFFMKPPAPPPRNAT